MKYESGVISLSGSDATLNVPKGFKFIMQLKASLLSLKFGATQNAMIF
jgi:hypothetical protein